jgi:Tfp pilus assembly protein PilN
MSKNEFEFEFDVSDSSATGANKPTANKPTAEPKIETKTETKVEQNTVKETVDNLEDFEKPHVPNILEKLEKWLKESSGIKFWFKVKAITMLPALIILVIFIIYFTSSLSSANDEYDALAQEKEQIETQLEESKADIKKLSETIADLQESNKKLTAEKENLDKQLATLATAKQTPTKPVAKSTAKPAQKKK